MLPACGANAVGTIRSAMSSIAVLRARFAVHPRFIRPLESQPPAIEPTATNAQRQPHVSAIQGTTRGVTIAPVFVPALKIPVASARSSFGNHSPTLLIEPGKLADSPNPSIPRAAAKAAVVRANAVLI